MVGKGVPNGDHLAVSGVKYIDIRNESIEVLHSNFSYNKTYNNSIKDECKFLNIVFL